MKFQISHLIPRCESVSRQLRAWADSLQNSDIAGQRHLNDASRLEYDQRKRSAEFLRKLKSMYLTHLDRPADRGERKPEVGGLKSEI